MNFPNIEQNNFRILDCKKKNNLLNVAFCAGHHGSINRLCFCFCLFFCLTSPSCVAERLFAKREMGTTNNWFILIPDFYNDSLETDFSAFLDHAESWSE